MLLCWGKSGTAISKVENTDIPKQKPELNLGRIGVSVTYNSLSDFLMQIF